MKVADAVKSFQQYQARKVKHGTEKGYTYLLKSLSSRFGRRSVRSITSKEIRQFLTSMTRGHSPGTKRLRWNQTKAFFTYCIRDLNVPMTNPCAAEEVKRAFKMEPIPKKPSDQKRIERIFPKVKKERDKVIMGLLGKVGFEAGELLALRASDVWGRKVKVGPRNYAYLPKTLALTLKKYIKDRGIGSRERIFKLSYSGLRLIVLRYGSLVNLQITPNDLRKHAGIVAYGKGVPLEFISRIMYRHKSLETTMRYLGLSRLPHTQKELYEWVDSLEK